MSFVSKFMVSSVSKFMDYLFTINTMYHTASTNICYFARPEKQDYQVFYPFTWRASAPNMLLTSGPNINEYEVPDNTAVQAKRIHITRVHKCVPTQKRVGWDGSKRERQTKIVGRKKKQGCELAGVPG